MKKVILFNLFLIVVILVVLESLVRFFGLTGLQGYDKDAFLSENNITFSKPNRTFKVFGKKVQTDQNGFRIPLDNFTYNKKENYILVLGDSVTFGVGVEEKNSYIGILRQKFKKKNILNAAIFGHNLQSYFYIIKKNNKDFKNKIDKVIIFLSLNDIVPYQGVIFKKNLNQDTINKSFFESYQKNKFFIKLNVVLREKSSLFVLLKGLFTKPIKRHYDYMNVLYDSENNLKEFEKYINQITNFSKKNNLNLEFVLLPYAYQVINNCKEDLLTPQFEIIKIFSKLNLDLKNYTNEFCETPNKNDLFLKYDPVHLSNYGHKQLSNLLISDGIFN